MEDNKTQELIYKKYSDQLCRRDEKKKKKKKERKKKG